MRQFSVSDIGTRRFYRSALPLGDPFGPPFRRITFQHHFQVMCRVHLNGCQTSQKLITTHNYSTKRRSPLQPQQLPSPIIPPTDSCSNRRASRLDGIVRGYLGKCARRARARCARAPHILFLPLNVTSFNRKATCSASN